MSSSSDEQRRQQAGWAKPDSGHDRIVRLLKIGLPAGVGVVLAYLAITPLTKNEDFSFILDKNKVETVNERMRVDSATYRGEDDKGRPFSLATQAAIQKSAADPDIAIQGVAAQINLDSGPARISADGGRYNLDTQKVAVDGAVTASDARGYKIETRDVTVDLKRQKLEGSGGVKGKMPLGTFSAESMEADLNSRDVALKGRARLHIRQGAIK